MRDCPSSTAARAASTGSAPAPSAASSCGGLVTPRQQLVRRLTPVTAACVGPELEPLLDRLEAQRIALERRAEPCQLATRFLQAHDDVPQLRRGRRELGRQVLDGRESPLRRRSLRCRAAALLPVDCITGGSDTGDQVGDVPDPVSLGA